MVGFVPILLCLIPLVAGAQQQYFRQKPRNMTVHEGGEVVLECEIGNLAGNVQWSKDGFLLGFSPEIPGLPRYTYIGDKKSGVVNLKISNVSLEDDAEFQCQVGPGEGIKPIRINAKLTVIAPPSSIEIVGHPFNSKIEVKEGQELEIECLVKNSKPAAEVVWYRGHNKLQSDKISSTIIEVPEKKVKRYNVLSRIRIKPTSGDDSAEYSCEARHKSLPLDIPFRATVRLSVLYPPGLPYIEGYNEKETIRRGQKIELNCKSRGGNPPAQLIWYKNGEQITTAYRTVGRVSENGYAFQVNASDNKAKYKCEALNVMSPAPLKAEVTLSVFFAPTHVSISGATEAKANEKVNLTCTTDNSNPPAEIQWTVNSKQWRNTTSTSVAAENNGFVTTSSIVVSVGQAKRPVYVLCQGLNKHLTEHIVSTHQINVLYPPGQPIISGYIEGTPIPTGKQQEISCSSTGGNPLATLTWYKNDKKVNSVYKTLDNAASAEMTIYTNVTDNNAVYRCEASNSAMEAPFTESVKLNVYFPPETVRIKKEPVELKPGVVATLTCESSSSNPPAKLTWWKEGIPVPGATNTTKHGLHGGMLSTIELKVNITPEISGVVYTCQALNEDLERSVHDAFTLDVLYKPIFDAVPTESLSGVEGEPLVVALGAKGNPLPISYTWTKDGLPLTKKSLRILADGAVLNVTKLSRNDTGTYTCEGTNSEGSSSIRINITVKYPARIIDIPASVTVGPNENAQLYCTVEGNPLKEEDVTWKNKDLKDLDVRSTRTFKNSTSYLVVHSPTREDAGAFQCVVNNGIGNETSKAVHLLVKYKPEIDTTPSRLKAATNAGDTGRLMCRASAVPKATFKWSRDGSSIRVNTTEKYYIEFHEINLTTFESVLLVNNVGPSDYGKYECEVRNEQGFTTSTVVLNVTSAPDTPLSLTVLNVTHDAVTLSWVPGFDGGLKSSYRIRYKPVDSNSVSEGYRYLDVVVDNATSFIVSGLDLDTEYAFSIMAFNRLGSSKYLPDNIKARTSSTPPPSLHSPSHGTLDVNKVSVTVVAIVAVAGFALLALNILVVGCCLRRRARNKRVSGPSEQGSNKSATIEMYAPSSYNETVTGETLSSVSEKSENYSNGDANEEYAEDGRKVAASTYLIDQIDYPFQYPAAYEMQHQLKANHAVADPEMVPARNTLPHNPVGKKNYISNAMLPPHTIDGAYYNLQPDSRYVAYPPTLEYSHTMPTGNNSLRRQRGPVPPDVTVLHNNPPTAHNGPVLSATLMPQPTLSTFGQGYPPNLENEGHLV